MSYQNYQTKYSNQFPAIKDLSIKAKKRIPHVAWEYLESGTGDEALLEHNRTAFHRIQFTPRFCKGHLEADISTKLFGRAYSCPIGMAPVGLTGLIWPEAELILAKAANRLQVPFSLSTVATETPERVGKIVGEQGWFQLYPPKDLDLTYALLDRAKQSGFHTLVITADVPMASRRERTRRAGMQMPPKITARLLWDGIKHPIWSYYTLRRGMPRLRIVEDYAEQTDFKFVSGFVGNRLGGTLDWDYCKTLKDYWGGPVIIKGIMHPNDAKKAIEVGLDAIWISNHGGRQFNGAPASIEALPDIANIVNKRVPIIFDSGVRTGLDVMRALYLGADFVMLGRPFLYGVAALGNYGPDHVIHIFTDDLKNNMIQLGVSSVKELKALDK
ncbi:alpha-hydroxy acid oxidase [Winogradskyella alexanderae]|uniref:Alpha-hydroxy-acid oxidizing protein n=1 Tax=Winogradskyella alexanderae TaxID=2877123 RepID=A0ABS7XQ72_9FLAO|nr:alpha-hydroxy acid oxidase [Winogradskyella alexanderae]MCA0132167.1 alpha-hydroxy-acid oxidizing protein [Winogradskyella alexanderae]